MGADTCGAVFYHEVIEENEESIMDIGGSEGDEEVGSYGR